VIGWFDMMYESVDINVSPIVHVV